MKQQSNKWPKSISVDKRIVKILSGSTYANFPSALREIIVNSYDADAENVYIDIDLKKEILTIRDDGKGMSEDDFSFYLRIAGKSRKKETQLTDTKRRIVGQFGVGFLSVLPFCEKYLIETKKRNTDEIVHATITSTEYFRNETGAADVDQIPIYGGITKDSAQYKDQFTRIRLVGFSNLTKSFFKGEYSPKHKRNTIKNYSPLELLKWDFSENLPLNYQDTSTLGRRLNDIFQLSTILPFNVFFNQKKLFRTLHASTILDISEKQQVIGNIKFNYVILTDYKVVDPVEARFLQLRNLNVGVGERTTFDLGMDGKVYGKLQHLTGEVNITDGLNELISVSRDKFNFSPDYEKLKDFLRTKLAKYANELDSLNKKEKAFSDFENTEKVSSIKDLKKERLTQDIVALQNKGFVVEYNESNGNNGNKINKVKKVITLSKRVDNNDKTIKVLNKNYKLVSENWELEEDEMYPAVKFLKGKTMVNESYPLFQNKSSFDTFLKLHILFLEYLSQNIINQKTYSILLKDISSVFDK